jgi:hypothetical protein
MAAKAATKVEESIAEQRIETRQELVSTWQRQQAEPHFWIEFHQVEDDPVDSVHIGAAGVSYNIRKGQRVPIPQSALNALKLAVQELHEPVIVNERRYIRHTKRPRHAYSIDGTCTPQEARAWKVAQAKLANPGLEEVQDDNGLTARDDRDDDGEGGRLERLPE